MTILWRAHASSQDFFRKIDIGPHESRLRDLILRNEVGDPSDFSIILSGWNDTSSAPTLAPHRVRIDGINYVHFKTSVINFLIKVDTRPFPKDLLPVVVGGDPCLAVLQLEFFSSKEGRTLIPLLRRHKRGI